jgi:hypothetical protein
LASALLVNAVSGTLNSRLQDVHSAIAGVLLSHLVTLRLRWLMTGFPSLLSSSSNSFFNVCLCNEKNVALAAAESKNSENVLRVGFGSPDRIALYGLEVITATNRGSTVVQKSFWARSPVIQGDSAQFLLIDVVVSGIQFSPRTLICELSEGRKAKRVTRDNVESLGPRDQPEKPEKKAPRDRADGEAKWALKDPKG